MRIISKGFQVKPHPHFYYALILSLVTILSPYEQKTSAAENPTAPQPESWQWSRRHYPIRQGSTSDTETFLTATVPRLKNYVFKATPKNAKPDAPAEEIIGEAVSILQTGDNGELHKKRIKIHFKGLAPNVEYKLLMAETSDRFPDKIVDTRFFQTLDTKPRPLRFTTVSCMCDETIYENVRAATWEAAMKLDPEFFLMMGDQTYMDSFDFLIRGKATPLDMWQRALSSFENNPLFLMTRLRPSFATWDDHDTGIDNGNKDTPSLAKAKEIHLALYGADSIPGVVETIDGEIYHKLNIAGQNFFLLDNRSFRSSDSNDPFGQYGQKQQEWLFKQIENAVGPIHLVDGGMWGSPSVLKPGSDGKLKLTESFFGDHPENYKLFMAQLFEKAKSAIALHSGDIHASQIIMHGPEFKGTSRYSPFRFFEYTSSPMHSIVFPAKPGEPEQWPDAQRLVGTKNYSFISFNSRVTANGNLDLEARISSFKEMPDGKIIELPPITIGEEFSRGQTTVSNRRKILNRNFSALKKKSLIPLFLDFDDTLRIAPSKGVSATTPTDVALLPGVADKIAEYIHLGYLPVGVSNQGGIAAGKISFEAADSALNYTMNLIKAENPKARFFYYDLAERGSIDHYSKPNIGMAKHFEMLMQHQGFTIDWAKAIMVGDAQFSKDQVDSHGVVGADFSDSDRKFAENLRIRTIHPRDFFAWTPAEVIAIRERNVPGFQRVKNSCASIFLRN